ncbi:hypothetical protein J2X84_002003 [Pseudomonas corrugata]|uniref:hypothetical protein n=1 Tax=Pseudomonas corrugata TaxID=47879 RepID=UPI00285D24FB|nr:hypothetical protein [Pseudomonas corrugata]MDR7283179.1 hypothetical protein [Pseudomonas corrugata]
MSTTIQSVMTVALLSAACLTALADPPKKQNRISTVGEPTALQASPISAPAAEENNAADGAPGYIKTVGRTSSNSMHPNAPATVTAVQFTDQEM